MDFTPKRIARVARKINWPAFVYNRFAQRRRPDVKVFVIGFNKCATSTLHHFFRNHGLRSLHWREGDVFLAKEIAARQGNPQALKKFLDGWTVFSDLNYLDDHEFIEVNGLFTLYQQLYPEAYFVFNDRPVESWVKSRLNHRGGSYLARYLNATGMSKDDAVAQWETGYEAHRAKVLAHFQGHERFIHWRIGDDKDTPPEQSPDLQNLVSVMAADFRLNLAYLTTQNRTKG